jgi:hypothetical protein
MPKVKLTCTSDRIDPGKFREPEILLRIYRHIQEYFKIGISKICCLLSPHLNPMLPILSIISWLLVKQHQLPSGFSKFCNRRSFIPDALSAYRNSELPPSGNCTIAKMLYASRYQSCVTTCN